VHDTERAQKFGAAAFEETQIGGMIDDTGKIRVLVIDPHGDAVGCHRGSRFSAGPVA
jgi:hypothetical protein